MKSFISNYVFRIACLENLTKHSNVCNFYMIFVLKIPSSIFSCDYGIVAAFAILKFQ